jgi:hypothetical protein
MILTPGHAALPSGHATEAFTMALVLWRLLQAAGTAPQNPNPVYNDISYGVQLLRQAARIAINRTVAGVHFPVDSVAGALLGLTLGQYLVTRASGATTYPAYGFNGEEYPNDRDFFWQDIFDVEADPPVVKTAADHIDDLTAQTILPVSPSPLGWLWGKAKLEWS